MSEMADKAQIRAGRLSARDALEPAIRAEKSLSCAMHGAGAIKVPPGTVVSGFLPIRSELDLRPLMMQLSEAGARICVPVIVDKETIVFREMRTGDALVAGTFGTLQPKPEAAELDPQIMLVPLSAFDARGHRIGYGGGYYDRAIHRLQQKGVAPKLIGIAFDCQEVAFVPDEPHDIRLDAVLTESGYRPFADDGRA